MDARVGIVRPARRPSGWRAPGPPPLARTDILPGRQEDLCHLTGDWRILQRVDGHRWSLDDLMTAWFAGEQAYLRLPHLEAHAAPRRILDLGCGIGSVLLALAWRFPDAEVLGIEAQAVSVDLAWRSIAWNGVDTRCRVAAGDLRDRTLVRSLGTFDLVTGTPPYLPIGTAGESRRVQKAACNVEHRGGIEAYCAAAAVVLDADGVFVACEQAAQTGRVGAAAHAVGLAVTHTLPVVPRAGKAPLFAVHAMRRSGTTMTLPPLVVRDAHGVRTPEFRAVRAAMGMPP
jgi:tRNA1(Val) A37 N6-methylase TrmN6